MDVQMRHYDSEAETLLEELSSYVSTQQDIFLTMMESL